MSVQSIFNNVQTDIRARLIEDGLSQNEADQHLNDMCIGPYDWYAYSEHLDVEYRWDATTLHIKEYKEESNG